MAIDIVGTWCIGIPLCLLAAYIFKWDIVGVYTLLTTEEIFRLVVSLIIFKRRKWMINLKIPDPVWTIRPHSPHENFRQTYRRL